MYKYIMTLQSFQNIRNNKWLMLFLILIFLIITLLIGYFVIKNYILNTNNKYTPNRINRDSNDEDESKTVELLLFSTTWCPHCKSMKPDWEKIEEKYTDRLINGYKVIFINVDCTNENSKNEELMNKYKIEGFPSIILVKDNTPITFDANPSFDTLDQFLNSVLQ